MNVIYMLARCICVQSPGGSPSACTNYKPSVRLGENDVHEKKLPRLSFRKISVLRTKSCVVRSNTAWYDSGYCAHSYRHSCLHVILRHHVTQRKHTIIINIMASDSLLMYPQPSLTHLTQFAKLPKRARKSFLLLPTLNRPSSFYKHTHDTYTQGHQRLAPP